MNIFESINKVMEDIGAISKSSKNQTQGFMYRGIDAVMNALQPALIKNKVFIVPEVLEERREERTNAKGTTLIYSVAKVKYRFYAEDGSFIESTVIGEGMDSGDKSMNKAMSIAFKYCAFQCFCIPTEEMVDPDAETHELAKKEVKAPTLRFITPEQKAAILAEINRCGLTDKPILTFAKAKSLDDIPESMYAAIMENFKKTPRKQ